MAMRFIDGFDHYTTKAQMLYKWTDVNAVPNQSGRRSGSLAVTTSGGPYYFSKTLDSQSTWATGFAAKITYLAITERAFVTFTDSNSNDQITITMGTDSVMRAYRGTDSGTLLTTASQALTFDTWHYVEAKVVISDSAGSVEVRLNGTTVLSYSGDTKSSDTLSTANKIRYGAPYERSAAVCFDDLYICDGTGTKNNSFLGDCRVDTKFPTGTGASTQFTPSGGANNWDNVNDAAPDGDSTYNYADTASYADSFAFEDVSSSSTIHGLQVSVVARKDDAGTRTMAATTTVGGTRYDGDTKTLGDTYVNHAQVWENNPTTSTAWTDATVSAAEFGYKVVA